MPALVHATADGLFCPAGNFHIDPWRPVAHAVVTHAHADHARPGSQRYLTSATGAPILRHRLDPGASIDALTFGQTLKLGDVTLSFHPAGHILGSAQVRLEHHGHVTVISGDYKTTPDRTCEPFEPIRCDTFITESTFGLPIYRWRPEAEVFADINAWWRDNQTRGRTSVVFAYALGKAQRVIAGVDASIGPIVVHGAVARFVEAYAAAGIAMPPVVRVDETNAGELRGRALVVAPPSANGSAWLKRFGNSTTAFASGWMQLRGTRRRRGVERGFPLSDHADWPGLLDTIRQTGATQIGVSHGYTTQLARYLAEHNLETFTLATHYEGDDADNTDA